MSASAVGLVRGDHDLNPDLATNSVPVSDAGSDTDTVPGLAPILSPLSLDAAHDTAGRASAVLRPAAVLVPVVARAGALRVILTVRSANLKSHAGQIAFPGGKIDAGDDGPFAAALREAGEEIGLASCAVEPIGYLERYRTGTGYAITPCVALISPNAQLVAEPNEVDDIFEVPLGFLMDSANHRRHTSVWQGKQRSYYAMAYGERFIWGATAGILKTMHERLMRP